MLGKIPLQLIFGIPMAGIRGFRLKDIEILRDELGKPIVNTYNNLREICIKYNIKEIKVSISHSENYAVANAIIISEN